MENLVFVDEEYKGGEFRLGWWFGRAGAIFMEKGAKIGLGGEDKKRRKKKLGKWRSPTHKF